MQMTDFIVNPLLRTQLDIYCINLRFDYDKKIVDTFFDKVFYAISQDERFVNEHGNIIVMHLIINAVNSLERKLLKGFLEYIESYHKIYNVNKS